MDSGSIYTDDAFPGGALCFNCWVARCVAAIIVLVRDICYMGVDLDDLSHKVMMPPQSSYMGLCCHYMTSDWRGE